MSTATSLGDSRTVEVLDASGTVTGTAELPAALFDVTANIPLIHQVVVAQLAAARQGTHATKTRGEVSGGGAKPYRQKGTGRARQGSRRAPQWVGGGVVHGPQPHGYGQRTPKKMIAAALRGALSDRAREDRVHVVSALVSGDTPSTKTALAALAAVTNSDKVLVVLHRNDAVSWLSLRNAAAVHVISVDQLNAYDVLRADEIVFSADALEVFVGGRRGSEQPALRQAQGTENQAGTGSQAQDPASPTDSGTEPETEPVPDQPAPDATPAETTPAGEPVSDPSEYSATEAVEPAVEPASLPNPEEAAPAGPDPQENEQ